MITQPLPPQSALPNLASLITSITSERRIEVTREKRDAAPPPDARETTAHLARLWAHGQSMKLNRSTRANGASEAAALATSYQLVTPVTGTVVLETAQQYEVAGLKPVDANTVPTVPERSAVTLLIASAALMLRRPHRTRIHR